MHRPSCDEYEPYLTTYARALQCGATGPAKRLWAKLRRRALGVRVMRQRPVGPYVVDFLVPEARLVVEVDGGSHAGGEAENRLRQGALEARGLAVLRVPHVAVLADAAAVARYVHAAIQFQLDHLNTPSSEPDGVCSALGEVAA